MPDFKITVLRRMANWDLAEQYCEPDGAVPCDRFEEGQEFLVEGLRLPESFCSWAWNDLYPAMVALRQGGSFEGWSKDKDSIVRCCTDGIRPVVFEIKKINVA